MRNEKYRGRKGRFRIANGIFEDYPEAALFIMSKMLITSAHHDYARKCFEYTAYSKLFPVIEAEGEIPFYVITAEGEETLLNIAIESENGAKVTEAGQIAHQVTRKLILQDHTREGINFAGTA